MLKHCIALSLTLVLFGCSRATQTSETVKPSGYRIYVTNETSGDLSVIDSASMTVTSTIPLGKRPRGIHASPDNRTIYVALSGTPPAPPGTDESKLPPADKSADGIGVFDVQSNKLVRTIQGGSDPENFDISHDGRTLFVSNEDVSGVSFIDTEAGKVTQTIRTGEQPEGVKVTPDGRFVYSTSEEDGTISVIDAAARKLVKTFKVGRRPRNIVFMPDGKRGYVNAENDGGIVAFDAVKNEAVMPIPLGKPGEIKPMGLQLSSDASQLYITTGRGQSVFVLNTATEQVVTSFQVGRRPWGVGISPDGKTLFTANGPSNDVSVIDLQTNAVTKKIKVGTGPYGVAVVAP